MGGKKKSEEEGSVENTQKVIILVDKMRMIFSKMYS